MDEKFANQPRQTGEGERPEGNTREDFQDNNEQYVVTPAATEQLRSFFEKKIFWGLGAGAVLVVVALIWLLGGGNGAADSKLVLWFDSEDQITSGSQSDITLVYENQGRENISNLELELLYPEGFQFVRSSQLSRDGEGKSYLIEELSSGESGTVVITGIFTASPQETKTIRAKAFYSFPKSSAVFSESGEAALSFKSPDFNLRVTAAPQVIDSQQIEYQISFKNISDRALNDLELRPTFPNGFTLLDSSLEPEDGIWKLDSLEKGDEQRVTIAGTLSGDVGEDKVMRVDLGISNVNDFEVLARSSVSTRIMQAPLEVSQLITNLEDATYPGETLTYKISYKNNGNKGLNNVNLKFVIDGEAPLLSSIRTTGGALVGREVRWNPSGRTELVLLKPNTSGDLDLFMTVANDLADRKKVNPVIKTAVFISSDEFPDPIPGNEVEVKIQSDLDMKTALQHLSGPNPPTPEQTTTYKLILTAESFMNSLDNGFFMATVPSPPGQLIISSLSGDNKTGFGYNEASGRMTWKFGEMDYYSSKTLEFQVEITPSVADFGNRLQVIKNLSVSAEDNFTGLPVISKKYKDLVTETVR